MKGVQRLGDGTQLAVPLTSRGRGAEERGQLRIWENSGRAGDTRSAMPMAVETYGTRGVWDPWRCFDLRALWQRSYARHYFGMFMVS